MKYICTHKSKKYNFATGKVDYFPCGKCPTCIARKAAVKSQRISREIMAHRYNYLITLTYDVEHIPYAYLQTSSDDTSEMYLRASDSFVSSDGEEAAILMQYNFHNPKDILDLKDNFVHNPTVQYDLRNALLLQSFTNLFPPLLKDIQGKVIKNDEIALQASQLLQGYQIPDNQLIKIPIINYYDIKIFFKTIRNKYLAYAKKACNYIPRQPYKYAVLAEYGTKWHRPHYHLVLSSNDANFDKWFTTQFTQDNQKSTKKSIAYNCVHWQHGITNFQRISTSAVSSYVSSYVTNTASDGAFYQIPQIRPRNKFSQHYGETLCDGELALLRPFAKKSFSEFAKLWYTDAVRGATIYYKDIHQAVEYVSPKIPFTNLLAGYDTLNILQQFSQASIGQRTRKYKIIKHLQTKLPKYFNEYVNYTTAFANYTSDTFRRYQISQHYTQIYYRYQKLYRQLQELSLPLTLTTLNHLQEWRKQLDYQRLVEFLGNQAINGFYKSVYLSGNDEDELSNRSYAEAEDSINKLKNRKKHNEINHTSTLRPHAQK